MTVQYVLKEGQSILFYAEVETPMLDAMILLSEAREESKEKLLSSLPEAVSEKDYLRYRRLLDLRCSGQPVSYIRRRKEFYSLDFYVDERVLVPRPDTEILVEEALNTLHEMPLIRRLHDACTGSGCIAITLKHELPELEITASDKFPEVEEIFYLNSTKNLSFPLTFYLSDLLEDVPGNYDLITANPPYLKDTDVENMKKIGWPEPELALKGGLDGTTVAKRLIEQSVQKLYSGGFLLLEAAPDQMKDLMGAAESAGFREISIIKDLAGRERVFKARMHY